MISKKFFIKFVILLTLTIIMITSSLTLNCLANDKVTMRIGVETVPPSSQNVGVNYFVNRVKQLSDGQIEAKSYFGTLGTSVELIESVEAGTLEAVVCNPAPLSNWVQAIGIINLPYLFDGFEHWKKVVGGSLGKELEEAVAKEVGIRILGWWLTGSRDIWYNGKPIRTPEDMKGRKIRVMQTPEYIALYKAYGAIPTPLPWGEVYMALKQGVVDGAQSVLTSGYSEHQQEVVKYVTRTKEVIGSNNFLVNEKWWNSLSDSVRDVILQAMFEASDIVYELSIENDKKAEKLWKDAGVEIIIPNRRPFMKVAYGIYSEFAEKYGQEKFDWIKKVGETVDFEKYNK